MNGRLSEEVIGLEQVLRKQLRDAGGVDVLRRAVADPAAREKAGALLDVAGVWELDPRGEGIELEAAAVAARAAGAVALPYPVAERLARRGPAGATMLVSTTGPRRVAAHADLPLDWSAVDLTGALYEVAGPASEPLGTRLGPFVAEVTVRATGERDEQTAALVSTLQSWWLLGLLRAAFADTLQYTGERQQFGRVLRDFQALRFQLADHEVALAGLEELAKHTLWSVRENDGAEALTDALALRLCALEAAGVVLRGAHQMHGAMGFTDEVDISWLSRASQPVRRLPEGETQTNDLLVAALGRTGYAGITGTHG